MLRRLLGKVDDGRFGRALAGIQVGWQWDCKERKAGYVEGYVKHGSKQSSSAGAAAARHGAAARMRSSEGCCASILLSLPCQSWGWQRLRVARTGTCRCWGVEAPLFWSRRYPAPRAPDAAAPLYTDAVAGWAQLQPQFGCKLPGCCTAG
ncbi:hypothetical protein LX24_02813 [Desulfallas thermosapovorans DSM 6562]|uniref:Uncharacterized protein n=1 Tax=Desulfallas thermosapovorans DSM 6562 TaxID=1121431 RepID=A0A5S4ZNM6_9FIRM|nr:hypothetical protein LX24_02813 [Desulfallas thermosapovorans DSM 6562]